MRDRFSALLKLVIFVLCINTAVSKCCLTKYGDNLMFPRNCDSSKATLHINSESLTVEFFGEEQGHADTKIKLNVGGCEVGADLFMSGDTQQLKFKIDGGQEQIMSLPVTATATKELIKIDSPKTYPPDHIIKCEPYFKIASNGNHMVDVEISLDKKSPAFYAIFKSAFVHESNVPKDKFNKYMIASLIVGTVVFLIIIGSSVGFCVYRRAQLEAEQKEYGRTSTKSNRTTRVRVINEEEPKPFKPEAFLDSDEERSEKSRIPRSSRR